MCDGVHEIISSRKRSRWVVGGYRPDSDLGCADFGLGFAPENSSGHLRRLARAGLGGCGVSWGVLSCARHPCRTGPTDSQLKLGRNPTQTLFFGFWVSWGGRPYRSFELKHRPGGNLGTNGSFL